MSTSSSNPKPTTLHMDPSVSPSARLSRYTIRPATPSDLSYLPAIESSAATLFTSIPELSYLATDEPMSVDAHVEVLNGWGRWRWEVGLGGWGNRSGDEDVDGGVWVVVLYEDGDDGREGHVVGFVSTEVIPLTRRGKEDQKDKDEEGEENGQVEGWFIHVNELSVAAEHQRRRLAGRLLGAVKEFARMVASPSISPRKDDGDVDINVYNNDNFTPGLSTTNPPIPKPPILGLTLTTFRNIPFNAPIYAKHGFQIVEDGDVERVVGSVAAKISREDRERFEGGGGVDGREVVKRCWMVCWL